MQSRYTDVSQLAVLSGGDTPFSAESGGHSCENKSHCKGKSRGFAGLHAHPSVWFKVFESAAINLSQQNLTFDSRYELVHYIKPQGLYRHLSLNLTHQEKVSACSDECAKGKGSFMLCEILLKQLQQLFIH